MVSIIVLVALDMKFFLQYLTMCFRSFEDEENIIDTENFVREHCSYIFFFMYFYGVRESFCYYCLRESSMRHRLYANYMLSENGWFVCFTCE